MEGYGRLFVGEGATMFRIAAGVIVIAVFAVAAWLWTPVRPFDAKAARKAAEAYDARIIRDAYGVPHIYGRRDGDVAFGLAYAHAEDDWKTIEDVILFSRGELARRTGRDGAVTDYLIASLNVWNDIDAKYERDLSPELRAVLDGYAAGVNLWCAERRSRCAPGVAPVSPKDIVAGFVARTPFFYGLEEQLAALFKDEPTRHAAIERARYAFLRIEPGVEIGSNAMAVAPSRSADGHTRLMVNSHQPYTGPVAWYEARVKSEEGWDMIGGIFPGAPVILHGAGPNLGWAFTVNKPDLVDVYTLEVDNAERPRRYKFDGGWRDFEVSKARLRVRLFGPFSLPVTRETYRTIHGPAFVTPNAVVAVSYGGAGDVRAAEQWYRLNKATDFESWRSAMAIQGIPSFNVVYADKSGRIAFYYNEAVPIRAAGENWSAAVDGARPDLVWRGAMPFGTAPHVVDPESGYVLSANHSPFKVSGDADNPRAGDFPAEYGIDQRTTNRGLRIQTLYGGDSEITGEEFVAYKMDDHYADQSRVGTLMASLANSEEAAGDPELADAIAVIKGWDRRAHRDSGGAALALRTARLALGDLLDGVDAEEPEPREALRRAARELIAAFGRLDPPWSEVMKLRRGDLALEIDGGPDTLRAVYPAGESDSGPWTAAGGDTYILYSDWASDGSQELRTIHQFGAATLDAASPHYADQAPLFAAGEWRAPPLALHDLMAQAVADYRPGGPKGNAK